MASPRSPEPYEATLSRYLADPSEAGLSAAYELGREIVTAGRGALDVLQRHQHALDTVVAEADPDHVRELVARAGVFLAEALSPFEMVRRGFDEATHERRRVAEEYRSLVENAPIGIARCKVDGTFVSANPALSDLLGYLSPAELLRENPGPLLLGPSLDALRRAGKTPVTVQAQWARRDGRTIDVYLMGRLVPPDDPQYLEILCEDVSERHRLEARLREAQKLEAIGRLAAGVAHDFNNFITGIMMCAHILRRGIPQDHPLRKHVDDIETSARTAGMVTEQLLAFGRQQVREPRLVRPDRVVHNVHTLLDRLLDEDVTLEVIVEEGGGTVRMDAGQLEQVLMNLVLNARDAMPDGGRVRITVRNLEVADGEEEAAGPGPGRWVCVSVRDEGVGIDAETQARIFEPFFTTKRGSGTGLGLSTVYGIVTQHEGHLYLESAPNQGSTFNIFLPRAEDARTSDPALAAPARAPVPRARLLLAEDDPTIRHAASAVLEAAGYAVYTVGRGDDALKAVDEEPGIDLLVTDVMMPGASGREVAEQFRRRHPNAGVLFLSGQPDQALREEGIDVNGDTLLRKPFAPDDLVARIADLLEDAG